MSHSTLRRAAALAAVFALASGLAAGTASAAPADQPDLRVTATVADNQQYLIGDEVSVKVTITNAGTGVAKAVRGSIGRPPGSDFAFYTDWLAWGDLSQSRPGGTIEAGATLVVDVKGKISGWKGSSEPAVSVYVSTSLEKYPPDNNYNLRLPVVHPSTKAPVGGIVFGDRNNNGAPDPGEGLAGVKVQLNPNGEPYLPRNATTDANGQFGLSDVSAGVYYLSHRDLPDGWLVPRSSSVRVDGSDRTANLRTAAIRPLSDVLQAKAEFNPASYQPGEPAKVNVTLTNSGPTALTNIKANCDGSGGESPHIAGWDQPAQWGELASGATIDAGQTRTFAVTGTITPRSLTEGWLAVECEFGDQYRDHGLPYSGDTARIEGKTGNASGDLFYDRNGNDRQDDGEGIANTKIGLVDPHTGNTIAEAVTNSAGRVEFTGVPAGRSRLAISGPWELVDANNESLVAEATCRYCGQSIRVKPKA